MGMDVYGKAPEGQPGHYFRRSVWGWRPLADFIDANAADEAKPCTHWHSNDGDGLNARQSVKLADRLDELVSSGEAGDWIALRDAALNGLGDEKCFICLGSGIRNDDIGREQGWTTRVVGPLDSDGRPNPRAGQIGSCNACGGRGTMRPSATYYGLTVADVAEFSAFVRASGGFRIC